MTRTTRAFVPLVGLAAAWVGFAAEEPASLKQVAPKGLLIGVALNERQISGEDAIAESLVPRHFNSITPENLLKWALVHPEPARYDFGPADGYITYGEKHGMTIIGHTLVWHNQTPDWVFKGVGGRPADRETLLARMRDHITTVVGRYRGRIKGWDVVNEAVADDGSVRRTPWLAIIGEEYLVKAFEYAHAADPDAELYYNDYNLHNPAKRATALRIVRQLKERGLRVDGIGMQGHWLIDKPPLDEIEAEITDLASTGLKVMVTELDIDPLPRDPSMFGADLSMKAKMRTETNIYASGMPPEKQAELAKRYGDVFRLFMKHRDKITRITFWGLTDRDTWLNDFPIRDRVNHPLLWDREGKSKPAFDAAIAELRAAGGQ
jgi:endo-1,4-beta-xylanase